MPRHGGNHVDRQADVFRLPGIHENNRVVNSDFRQAEPRPPEVRQTHSFPVPHQNGHLVASENATANHMTYYTTDAHGLRAENPPAQRQQSLPTRKHIGEDYYRQAKSAPSRKDRAAHNGGAPLPRINNLMARSRGPDTGGDQGQGRVVITAFAGVSTKNQNSSLFRSNKFASSWAQVRAENHLDVPASSEHPKQSPRDSSQEAERSRDRARNDKSVSPHRTRQHDPSPGRRKGDNRSPGRSDAFHARSQDKVNIQPPTNAITKKEQTSSQNNKWLQSPQKTSHEEKKEKHEIRFITPDEEDHDHQLMSPYGTGDTDITSVDNQDDQEESQDVPKRSRRRPAWDNRLTLKPPDLDLKVKSQRRYEAELTHKPAVSSTDQVYKAYTGHSKQGVRDSAFNTDSTSPRGRPPTKDSHTTDNSETSYPNSRYKKDYILSRNETKMYLHVQGVYGSDAFRTLRKEYFFKKISDLQQQEEKLRSEDRRKAQHKREESKRRQHRQLMYVRRKFRRQQLHRFRTQYVTSRVLEYEKADRDLYGLPGDSDSDDLGDESGYSTNKSESAKPAATKATKNNNQNKNTPKEDSAAGAKESKDSHENKNGLKEEGAANKQDSGKEMNVVNSKQQQVKESGDSKNSRKVQSDVPGKQSEKNKKTDSNKTDDGKEPVNNAGKATSDRKTDPNDAKDSKDRENKKNEKVSNKDTQKAADVKQEKKAEESSDKTDPKQSKTDQVSNTRREKDSDKTKAKNSAINSAGKDVSKGDATGKMSQEKPATKKDDATKPATTGSSTGTTQAAPIASKTAGTSTKTQTAGTSKDKTTSNNTLTNGHSAEKEVASPKGQSGDKKDENTSQSKEPAKKTETSTKPSNETTKGATVEKKSDTQKEATRNVDRKDKKLERQATSDVGQVVNSVSKPEATGKKESEKENDGEMEKTGKRTTIRKESKGRYITMTKVIGSTTATAAATTTKDDTKPRDNRQSSQDRHGDKAGQPSQNRSRSDSKGRKRKPAHAQPLTEAEQKKQLEKKYGKMFDVNVGPSWNAGSKPPKMEGIDTVVVKETDSKGRVRYRKKEVKDVVKEARKMVAEPTDPDSPDRSGVKAGQKSQTNTNRPPTADTLDCDDDDDDDEDVFEKMKKKYNLQIDSDNDV